MYKYLQSTSVGTHSTRSKRPRLSRCVTLLLLYFCSPTAGRVYYVDNQNGLDENTGILENAAWQTLSKVSRTTFQAGDTVKMKCGSSWTGQSLTINGTGAETSPILFTSYGDGAAPRLGGLTSAQGNGINVRGSRVILEKIMVSDVVQSGCWVTGSHVTIRAIEFTKCGAGTHLAGEYGLVTGCYFHDMVMVVNTPGGNDDYGAMGVWFFNSNNEVSYCRFVKCVAPSYDYRVDGGGVEIWAGSQDIRNISVHHNYAYRCAGFFEIGGTNKRVSNVKVSYNVLVDCFGLSFIYFNTSGDYAVKVRNYYFENNTCVVHNCPGENMWTCIDVGTLDTAGTFVLRNNIFHVFSAGSLLTGGAGALISNNLIYYAGTAKFNLGFTQSATDITGKDPLFKNLGTSTQEGDYHILLTSPAVNKGAALGYTYDFAGVPIPYGSAPDIGAYEYTDNAPVIPCIHNNKKAPHAEITGMQSLHRYILSRPGVQGRPEIFQLNGKRIPAIR